MCPTQIRVRKMNKIIFFLAIVSLSLQSCSIMRDVEKTNRTADYTISLTSVELPANAKEQFGETITIDNSKNDTSRYVYEDEYMKILWFVGSDKFYFTLYNKSNHALKIIWDDATLVMPDNSISKLMHNGVKYSQRNEAQVATTIPRGAKIEDVLVPTENVIYSDLLGWFVSPMFKYSLSSDYEMEKAKSMKGEVLKVLLPIKIEDIQNEYTFVFTIKDVQVESKKIIEKEHDKEAETAVNVILGIAIGALPVIFLLNAI